MKRSEMIKELLKVWKHVPPIDNHFQITEIILREAERLGMQPPYAYNNEDGQGDYQWEEESKEINNEKK